MPVLPLAFVVLAAVASGPDDIEENWREDGGFWRGTFACEITQVDHYAPRPRREPVRRMQVADRLGLEIQATEDSVVSLAVTAMREGAEPETITSTNCTDGPPSLGPDGEEQPPEAYQCLLAYTHDRSVTFYGHLADATFTLLIVEDPADPVFGPDMPRLRTDIEAAYGVCR